MEWAEERGAKPARVKGTGRSKDDVGLIRLEFGGRFGNDEKLEEVGWDDWFEEFEKKNLALIIKDESADGKKSNFNKLVSRDSVEE